jgi:PAP2 superfamily protein
MVPRSRSLQARVFPHGWADVLRQIALFGAAYLAYRLVRGGVDGRAAAAFQHAREVINLERGVHVFVEPSVQAWASGSHLLIDIASWIYINAQTTTMIGALLWLYVQRNSSFYFVRNMMIVSMAIALVGYIVFPTAPPRMLPEWGFADTVADLTGVHTDSVAVSAVFNPYAAIPSMHLAMALMIGWPLAKLVRPRPLRVFWAGYPLLMLFVIVVTANHFLIDGALGALTAGLAAVAARSLARARPRVWAFSEAGATA